MDGLGKKIRELRKKQALTIVDITAKTGIDKATLSRIESGKMRGTVNAHMKIAEALNIRLPDLYEGVLSGQQAKEEKISKKKIETFSHASGAVAELLTSGALQKKMLPVLLKIKAGGRTETEEYPIGTERFAYIMSGAVELTLGTETLSLKRGESLYFNAARPHHFENQGTAEAVCMSVITPASL